MIWFDLIWFDLIWFDFVRFDLIIIIIIVIFVILIIIIMIIMLFMISNFSFIIIFIDFYNYFILIILNIIIIIYCLEKCTAILETTKYSCFEDETPGISLISLIKCRLKLGWLYVNYRIVFKDETSRMTVHILLGFFTVPCNSFSKICLNC